MKIDTLITGTEIVSAKPKFLYENGESTNVQDSIDGVPVWTVEVAVKDGVYVLPLRVKVASPVEPEIGKIVQFRGVEINVFRNTLYYSADTFKYVSEDGLEELFTGGK